MGRSSVRDRITSLRHRAGKDECAVMRPFRAKILFYQTPPHGSVVSVGFRGELQEGALAGDMMGLGRPSLKLTLYRKDDGRLELRGIYSSGPARSVSGEFRLERAASK